MTAVDIIHGSLANYHRWAQSLARVYMQCVAQAPWDRSSDPQTVDDHLITLR